MATPPYPSVPPTVTAPPPAPLGGLEADLLLDRRRLKRSRGFWRALAILAALGVVAVVAGLRTGAPGLESLSPHLGTAHLLRLNVSGAITDDRRLVEAIDRATRADAVRGMILSVDSPGGTVAGGESLHAALTRFRAMKPLVAVFGGTAASAGYMIAMPAERIYARAGSLTGSIGVLLPTFDVSEAMRALGLRSEAITSGPLKDQPSPFRPLTERGRTVLQGVVDDFYAQFVGMVAAGRGMPEERVRALADGRVMTGRQALEAGLVDAIGGEREAREHLASAHGLATDLPVRDLSARDLRERSFGLSLAEAAGTGIGEALKSVVSEWLGPVLRIDGARALWQPAGG